MPARETTFSQVADVLVIGGGLSGGWAATAAARAGARVVLVDKGYFGTSGVTATSGPGHWWIPPGERALAIEERLGRAFGLADPAWMERLLETTWETLPTLSPYYAFPDDGRGNTYYRGLRGPEYLRALRAQAEDLGVQIFDQSPALELLLHGDGSVAGARGVQRQIDGGRPWSLRAAAVILATGGCAFRSPLLGSQTNTGDGYLMGVEAGAELSGMEFSSYHTVALADSSMTRSAPYAFADYYDARGALLPTATRDYTRVLARALLEGPVYATLSRTPPDLREALPHIQPATLLAFKRKGIDPYSERFPVTLHGEGTVRGTGGLRVVDENCQTAVPGLYAAGDAASRELIAGATSGGGNQNSAWALSSGIWSGRAAALRAKQLGARADGAVKAVGGAGIRPLRAPKVLDVKGVVDAVRAECLPYDKVLFRHGARLERSLASLDSVWKDVRDHAAAEGRHAVAVREAAALVASARWAYSAASLRKETRGMHIREDHPELDPKGARRLIVGGFERVYGRFEGDQERTWVST